MYLKADISVETEQEQFYHHYVYTYYSVEKVKWRRLYSTV